MSENIVEGLPENIPTKEEMESQDELTHRITGRDKTRHNIFDSVDPKSGLPIDSDSLLGTVSDAAQMLVLNSCVETVTLAGATTFKEYKTAKTALLAKLAGGDAEGLVASAQEFIDKVKAKEIIFPYTMKEGSATGVFEDVGIRANLVSSAITK